MIEEFFLTVPGRFLTCAWFKSRLRHIYPLESKQTRAVASSIIGSPDIHIFVFCTINFFWNWLLLWCVNTNIWISAPPPPPIIELATALTEPRVHQYFIITAKNIQLIIQYPWLYFHKHIIWTLKNGIHACHIHISYYRFSTIKHTI